ncbi:MAG: hypothetical protein II583_05880 [Oscillospiraceae bacterium]|nr:hypothetical protein [Oscillospiraceae bacterium]
MELIVALLAAVAAIEAAAALGLIALRLYRLSREERRGLEPYGQQEETEASGEEKAIADAIRSIQSYDYLKAKKAVRSYGEEE